MKSFFLPEQSLKINFFDDEVPSKIRIRELFLVPKKVGIDFKFSIKKVQVREIVSAFVRSLFGSSSQKSRSKIFPLTSILKQNLQSVIFPFRAGILQARRILKAKII